LAFWALRGTTDTVLTQVGNFATASDDLIGGGILDDGKVPRTLMANQSKPTRDVLKTLDCLIRRSTMGRGNARHRRIDFGETVGRTTCRLRVTPDEEIHARGMVGVISRKNWYQCRRIEEDVHLKRSERRKITFAPNRLQRVVDHRSGR
jgi:hypothetical protein